MEVDLSNHVESHNDVEAAGNTHSTSVFAQHPYEEECLSPSTFYFESDHVALKGNADYGALLKTILILESQRAKAIKDLDILIEKHKEAKSDPIDFVKKLQEKADLGLPGQQNIPEIPDIDWERYTSNLDPLGWKQKHLTRNKQTNDSTVTIKKEKLVSETSSGANSEDDTTVRGRVPFSENAKRSGTFNQLWTPEEQRRLEDLLLEYPPEEVEMRRWEKIAQCLGNRTPHQVQSRTQKYFIKLAKLGLPIPGRAPNVSSSFGLKKNNHKHQRMNRFLYQPSTFLASHRPPVFMNSDDEDDNSSQGTGREPYQDVSDEEDVAVELRHTDEYRQIMELKRLKRQKMKDQQKNESESQHVGYKCDRCGVEPISGTRWHCTDCPDEHAVDFCDDCVDFEFQTNHHNASHHLKPVHFPESFRDTDYKHSSFMPTTGYNYLDPNYMPAS